MYVSTTMTGYLFDLDHSNVLRDIRYLESLVKDCIPIPEKVYERTKRATTPEEIEEYFPGFKAFIDATEQEIPRPKRKAKRISHYSGKKKRHTVKTQLTVNKDGLVVHRTDHARGRRNDYAIFKRNHPELPEGVRPGVDLGYNGIQNDFPEMKPMIPFKKRSPGRGHRGVKAKPLTPHQKRFNRELSKARVVVEHTISRVKKFRIMGEEFRNRLRHYDVMTEIVSGLVNLRILGR
jgi:DDE superfamily endonuclease